MILSLLATGLLLVPSASAFFRLPCTKAVLDARVDPIVTLGKASSHAHTIMGSNAISYTTTFEDLRNSQCSTCKVKDDKSAYWEPELYWQYPNGTFQSIDHGGMLVYYLQRSGPNETVEAFPDGLVMLAGDPYVRNNTGSDDSKAISWNCIDFNGPAEPQTPGFNNINCPNGLRAQVFFRSCWDGHNLDSPDHKSHMAYPDGIDNGSCPPTHPHHLISIFYEIYFNIAPFNALNDGGRPVLGNGDPTGFALHADFMNGWDHDVLSRAVANCTADSGVIEDCAVFEDEGRFYTDDENNACSAKNPMPEEKIVDTLLTYLPGCVAVTEGPGPASAADVVADCVAGSEVPVPISSSASVTTSTASTNKAVPSSSSASAATSSKNANSTATASSSISISVGSSSTGGEATVTASSGHATPSVATSTSSGNSTATDSASSVRPTVSTSSGTGASSTLLPIISTPSGTVNATASSAQSQPSSSPTSGSSGSDDEDDDCTDDDEDDGDDGDDEDDEDDDCTGEDEGDDSSSSTGEVATSSSSSSAGKVTASTSIAASQTGKVTVSSGSASSQTGKVAVSTSVASSQTGKIAVSTSIASSQTGKVTISSSSASSQKGDGIPSDPLTTVVHATTAVPAKPTSSAGTVTTSVYDWRWEEEHRHWHAIHDPLRGHEDEEWDEMEDCDKSSHAKPSATASTTGTSAHRRHHARRGHGPFY